MVKTKFIINLDDVNYKKKTPIIRVRQIGNLKFYTLKF